MAQDEKNIQKLADEMLEKLSDDEREKLSKRLSEDPDLKELASWLGTPADKQDRQQWERLQKPAHLLLESMLRDTRSGGKHPKKMQGVLTYDSSLLPLPEGVRSAAVGTRRLHYQVGEGRVGLSLYPVSMTSYELIGQIEGVTPAKVSKVELAIAGRRLYAEADAHGVFRFPRIPAGKCRIKMTYDKQTAQIALEI
jgi:hypothetical protein